MTMEKKFKDNLDRWQKKTNLNDDFKKGEATGRNH